MSLMSLVLVSLPEAILIAMLGFQLAGIKVTTQQIVTIGTLQTVVAYFTRFAPVPFGLHTIMQLAFFILILRIITGISIEIVVVTALIGVIVYLSLETVITPTILNLTGYSLNEVITSHSMRIIFFLPQATATFFIFLACKRYHFRLIDYSYKKNGTMRKDTILGILKKFNYSLYILILLPAFLLAVLNQVLFISQIHDFSSRYLNIFTTLFSLVVVAVTLLSMAALKSISDLKEKEIEAQKAGETITQLDKIIRVIRKQRHDFNHHLQTVYGLIEVNSCEMARDYIRQVFLDISFSAELVKTDNPSISAMLYAKAGLAEVGGTNFRAQVDCSLKDISLSTMETNSLLGNLLDNAIEAAENYSKAHRTVRLEISREPGKYIFTVANTGKPIPRETIEKMYDLNYTTKENNRGLGLSIVKEIIDKYSGKIDFVHCDNENIFTVHIPYKG